MYYIILQSVGQVSLKNTSLLLLFMNRSPTTPHVSLAPSSPVLTLALSAGDGSEDSAVCP